MSQYLIDELKEHPVTVNTPYEPGKRGTLVTYKTRSFDKNKKIYDEFKKNGIIVAHRYASGIGGIRVSCHFFNKFEEIDNLLKVQRKIL